jgi:hypothetical protein
MFPSYNHNVNYRGLILHVQTENLAAPRASVVTHVFCAGDIIATLRASYLPEEAAGAPEVHIKRMQAQHQKAMRALLHGEYDDALTVRGHILAPRVPT